MLVIRDLEQIPQSTCYHSERLMKWKSSAIWNSHKRLSRVSVSGDFCGNDREFPLNPSASLINSKNKRESD